MSETEEDRGYYQAAEAAFIRRRGTPFLLSPRDFALLKEWRALGVPIETIEQGIEEAFSRREERAAAGRVNSLSYCRDAVLEAWERRIQTSVGRGGRVGAAEPDVPRALEGLAGRLRACRAPPAGPRRSSRVGAPLPRAAGKVAQERRGNRGFPREAGQAPGRRAPRRALARPSASDSTRKSEASLARARIRMDAEAAERTARALTRRTLRDHLDLPRLTLL